MNILAIGAHPDDIEIGCGGSLAWHSSRGDNVMMVVLTNGEMGGASAHVRFKEFEEAANILGVTSVLSLGYSDTKIPTTHEPIAKIEKIINDFKPARVYIPFPREIHQDHRKTSEISLAACRNLPQILLYEGPSTFPDFQVKYWIDISLTLEKKLKAIGTHKSQGEKEILKIDAIKSLNRFRGYQARSKYAEGFDIFRLIEL